MGNLNFHDQPQSKPTVMPDYDPSSSNHKSNCAVACANDQSLSIHPAPSALAPLEQLEPLESPAIKPSHGTLAADCAEAAEPEAETKAEPAIEEESDEILEEWQLLKRTVLSGSKVKLVPYTAAHVPTYNKWLNDPYIQQMTGTEPYSLSQEYEYQSEWNEDRNKYIFIILDRSLDDAMAGDINLFIHQSTDGSQYAELNVMVAEEASRRKGLATETLQLMIDFARTKLELSKFVAKIQTDNESSLRLFGKLRFEETEYVEQFKEHTLTLEVDE